MTRKAQIVHRGSKPDASELLELMPSLEIEWVHNLPRPRIQVEIDPIYKIRTIDWKWFRSLFSGDHDIRALVFEPGELRGIGITDHWGFYSLDTDGVHDFYLTNLSNDVRAIQNGFKTTFAWMFVHEFLHGAVWALTGNRETAAHLVHDWEKQGLLKAKLYEHLAMGAEKEMRVNWLYRKAQSLLEQLKKLKPI